MKDISVSANERAIRLDTIRLLLFLNLHETAETIGNVVGQPGAAEGRMGSQPPYGKLSHIQLHIFLEGKQQAGEAVMLESIGFLESGALFEDAFVCQNLIDTIQPFLRIAAAALEDKPLPISHPAELFLGNLPYTHNFISSIVIACSWAISCWVSFRKLSTPGISERLHPLSQATPI